jgi:hypothetical protein
MEEQPRAESNYPALPKRRETHSRVSHYSEAIL